MTNPKIKFKLLSTDQKLVGYEKWSEGAFSNDWKIYITRPQWLYSKDGKYWNPDYIEHRYKEQIHEAQR